MAESFEDSGAEILRADDVSVRVIRDARSGKQVAVKRSELNKVGLLISFAHPLMYEQAQPDAFPTSRGKGWQRGPNFNVNWGTDCLKVT